MAEFIATEAIAGAGAVAEARVWQAVREAWRSREAVVYWRYPIFAADQVREPDILIVDREYGLIILEVKALRAAQILGIQGHVWTVQEYVRKTTQPYEQARRQLQALLDRLDTDPALAQLIPGRALVGLPLIQRAEWTARGLDALPSSPPGLFQDELGADRLLQVVRTAPHVRQAREMSDATWVTLLAALGTGGALRVDTTALEPGLAGQRAQVLARSRAHRYEFDLKQEIIAKVLAPGPQRIRGIAGSGKTILLAQKAAAMHLKHPDWKIALLFFNRSLYSLMERQMDRWLQYFSGGRVTLQQAKGNVQVFHAWGSSKQDGFYRTLCKHNGVTPRAVSDYTLGSPTDKLAQGCRDMLLAVEPRGGVKPLYDAVFIDESQDLVVNDPQFKYRNKQPVFWLAYQSVVPDAETGLRRLVWAYDEAQSLDAGALPTARELFGPELSTLVSGSYEGGIKKSEIMHRCYRTPGEILVAAHALGMGLLRQDGMLTGLTTRKEWEGIGYEMEGQFVSGRQVTLHRPPENSPNPLATYWPGPLVRFETFASRQAELDSLMAELKRNLQYDGLAPSRQILVVVLGLGRRKDLLLHEICRRMAQHHLDFYLPGQLQANDTSATDWRVKTPNRFWCDNAVTVTDVRRAKGNEADMVHVVGFDLVAAEEENIALRNQLFTGMTRSRGWLRLTGAGCDTAPMTAEVYRVLAARGSFTFTYRRAPQRILDEEEPEISTRPAWLSDWV